MASRRPFRRYSNSSIRSRLQTGPQNCNNLGYMPPVVIQSVETTSSGDQVLISFQTQIITNGVPALIDDEGNVALSMTVANGTQILVTFSNDPVVTPIHWPFQDPAIRNSAAGYVAPGPYPISPG